eukprot:TRINITY_DN8183_c0_g1_i1.p1 TRINITY_DN8183_c0_g1~~TRINITY_DN8183_c0_g1_i1.p1  ORF type:complete len:138 (+),score=14.46 TRINITY_DN8183_c0_g1_i1:55-468(+)
MPSNQLLMKLIDDLRCHNPFELVHPGVWKSCGDLEDRSAITVALLNLEEALRKAKKAYVVVIWGDRHANPENGVRSYVSVTPPDPKQSALHAKLKYLYDTLKPQKEVAVVVVDPAKRRKHNYTYVVAVKTPWADLPE